MNAVPERSRGLVLNLVLCALVIGAITAVYWPAAGYDIIFIDDPGYMENPLLTRGWDSRSLKAVLFRAHDLSWTPVTLASFLTDASLFGNDPGVYHRTNVLLHIANACLLFLFLLMATGRPLLSAAASAIFALHPLRVESVAWISERKDVLCTFFLLLAMLAYLRYSRRRRWGAYLVTALLFTLGLMAKPMLVTFPGLLLVLDFWPLRDFKRGEGDPGARRVPQGFRRLVTEKVPLLGLSAGFAALTVVTTSSTVTSLVWKGPWTAQSEPYLKPLAMAPSSYIFYLWKAVYPIHLTMQGIHVAFSIRWWHGVLALAVLTGVTALLWFARGKRPYLLAGWLWYLVSLFPVSGIMPNSSQWISDRYTYIPFIGLSIAAAWLVGDLVKKSSLAQYASSAAVVSLLCAMAILSGRQLARWRDSDELFRYFYRTDPANAYVRMLYSGVVASEGRLDEAIGLLRQNVLKYPFDSQSRFNLALRMWEQGHLPEAIDQLQILFDALPGNREIALNLGVALAEGGRAVEALTPLKALYGWDADYPGLRFNLANALSSAGKRGEAIRVLEEAVQADPSDHKAQHNLGVLYLDWGNRDLALEHLTEALKHTAAESPPGQTHFMLGRAYADAGDASSAIKHLREAVRLLPGDVSPMLVLADVLVRAPDGDRGPRSEAVALLEEVARAAKRRGEGFYAEGVLEEVRGEAGMARRYFGKALIAPFLAPFSERYVREALGARTDAASLMKGGP